MEFSDVSLFYLLDDGKEWALFLQNQLDECGITSELLCLESVSTQSGAVNVVLASPAIMSIDSADSIRSLNMENSFIVLLGVDEYELKLFFVKHFKFEDIFTWDFFNVEQSKESVCDLVHQIKSLLHKVRHHSASSDYDSLPVPRPTQPQLRRSKRHLTSKLHVATELQNEVLNVFIINNRKGSDEIEIKFDPHLDQQSVTAVLEDKALYRLQMPDDLALEKDFQFIGYDANCVCGEGTIPKLHSVENDSSKNAEEIIQDIFGNSNDPVPLMCRLLGLPGIDGCDTAILDSHLAEKFQNIAMDKKIILRDIIVLQESECGRWPTLLHFAAEFDLRLFGAELFKYGCSFEACLMMNTEKETPQMIALRNDFSEFATMIKHYIKTEVLKGHTTKKDSGIMDERKLPTITEHHHEAEEYHLAHIEKVDNIKSVQQDIPRIPSLFQKLKKKIMKRKNERKSDPLAETYQVTDTQPASTEAAKTMHRSHSSADTTLLTSNKK